MKTHAQQLAERLGDELAETAAERDRLRRELEGLRQWVRDGYAKKSVLERFDAALAKQKEPANG